MRWLAKAAVQKAVSYAPRSDALNYVLQRRVLRSLPAGQHHLERKFGFAVGHFEALLEHADAADPASAVFYEFGVGWDLRVPLAYYMLGADRQTLLDLHPHARVDLVNDSLLRLEASRAGLEQQAGRALRTLAGVQIAGTDDLARLGLTYLAPRDARATGLPAESVDFVSSTDTLEHVPRDDIARILAECRRLLSRGGVLSCRVDLEDHYSRFDRKLSRYNFLRYSDRSWALVNSGLHYQNRLRYPDYVRLIEEAGFDIVRERIAWATEEQLEELARVPLAARFRDGYSREELGVRNVALVARPAAAVR